jgi:hypothetical protein
MMNEVGVMADLVELLRIQVRAELIDLHPPWLDRRPYRDANSIGQTVWHFSRWLDALRTRGFARRDPAHELWIANGWAVRTGYDPRGVGHLGLGAITGYTPAEVDAIPRLSADDLMAYLDQVCHALTAAAMSLGELDRACGAPWETFTRYDMLKIVLSGCFGHVGEIQTWKAMYRRKESDRRTRRDAPERVQKREPARGL